MLTRYFLVLPITALFLQNAWADHNVHGNVQAFIPKNWNVLSKVEGDLNADGQADLALIIENTDPENIVSNEGFGASTLDLNPRKLLILFKKNQSYRLISSNTTLPSAGSADSPCLSDPLGEAEVLQIKKGVLKITLHYWLSCGSWFVTNNVYSFRYQNQAFKLIGFDTTSFHRASGETAQQSINFLTAKIKNTTGLNEFAESEEPFKISWTTLKSKATYTLNTFDFQEFDTFE